MPLLKTSKDLKRHAGEISFFLKNFLLLLSTYLFYRLQWYAFKSLLRYAALLNAKEDLHDSKDDFVVNVGRHFILIFHVGFSTSAITMLTTGSFILSSNANVGRRP